MTDSTPDTGLSSIGQISVNVKDLDRAVAFYRDLLGMRFLFTAPPQMAFFDCGGIRLLLGVPESPEFDHPASIIYYRVDDIQATYEDLKGRGIPFLDEPHLVHRGEGYELWMAFFRDSEENVLALMSEVHTA